MKTALFFLCVFALSSCFNGYSGKSQPKCGVKSSPQPGNEPPTVFKAKCAVCHLFDKDSTGPKMKSVLDRVPSEEWLRLFITQQDSLIAIEDSTTLKVMQWSPYEYIHHADLPEKDLNIIMDYITQ